MEFERKGALMSAGRPFDTNELIAQIGYWNVMSISGGRVTNIVNDEGETVQVLLPVSSGYRVSVELDWNDTWIVKRQYVRKGVVTDKAIINDVYCDDVGEVAYQASCYKNVHFTQPKEQVSYQASDWLAGYVS